MSFAPADAVEYLEAVRDSSEYGSAAKEAAALLIESGWAAGVAGEVEDLLEGLLLGPYTETAVSLLGDAQRVREERAQRATALELVFCWAVAGRVMDQLVAEVVEPFGLVPRSSSPWVVKPHLASSAERLGLEAFVELRERLKGCGWTKELDAQLATFMARLDRDPEGLGSLFAKVISRMLAVAQGFERKLAPEVLLLVASVGVRAFEEWRPWAEEVGRPPPDRSQDKDRAESVAGRGGATG